MSMINKTEIARSVFEELKHVNDVWVTDDGEFHLHSHKGGDKFSRNTPAATSEKEITSTPKKKK